MRKPKKGQQSQQEETSTVTSGLHIRTGPGSNAISDTAKEGDQSLNPSKPQSPLQNKDNHILPQDYWPRMRTHAQGELCQCFVSETHL